MLVSLIKGFYRRVLGRRPSVCFIHIPKTGGTYVTQYETDRQPVVSPVRSLGHTTIIEEGNSSVYPPEVGFLPNYVTHVDVLNGCKVFCVVRNIFSWLVSYAGHAGAWPSEYRDPNHYDYAIAQKGFDYLVKSIADRDGNIWPSRRFIHFQMFSDKGNLVVDYALRQEDLDNGLKTMSRELRLNYTPGPHRRVGSHSDYRSLYSDQLADIVASTWRRELDLFGYGFDGGCAETSVLPLRIAADTKREIRYLWGSDALCLGAGASAGG